MMSTIRRHNIPLISRPETVTRQYIKESIYLWSKKDFRKILNTTVGLELRALQAGYGNDSSLAHELTHTIFGASFSRSLEDGLCDCVQYHVGMQRFIWEARPDWSVAEAMKLQLPYYQNRAAVSDEKVAEGKETVGLAQGYSYGNTPTGSLWYVYSQCFVEYLRPTAWRRR